MSRRPAGKPTLMQERTLDEQLTKYLTDVHSIEVQAMAQLERAPGMAGTVRPLAAAFREHREETREQERMVREQLAARGADTARLKDIAGRVGGWAMIVFARVNPDTPGKLTAHAYSYEHMELAAYELLARIATRAGAQPVVDMAHRIGAQERAMGDRLAACFDPVADVSKPDVVAYLSDAHAIEAQALRLLESGPELAGFDELAAVFRDHLEETREQQRLVDERLRAHDARPSRFKSTGMRIGGLNIGGFFGGQPDTPLKLAGFAYAFEHLEIAGYELLRRVATRAGDGETAAVAERIAGEERRAAERIAATWDAAVEAGLRDVAVAPA